MPAYLWSSRLCHARTRHTYRQTRSQLNHFTNVILRPVAYLSNSTLAFGNFRFNSFAYCSTTPSRMTVYTCIVCLCGRRARVCLLCHCVQWFLCVRKMACVFPFFLCVCRFPFSNVWLSHCAVAFVVLFSLLFIILHLSTQTWHEWQFWNFSFWYFPTEGKTIRVQMAGTRKSKTLKWAQFGT